MPERASILFQTGFFLVAMSTETAVQDQVRRGRQIIMGGAPRFSHEALAARRRPGSRWEVRGRPALRTGSGFGDFGGRKVAQQAPLDPPPVPG